MTTGWHDSGRHHGNCLPTCDKCHCADCAMERLMEEEPVPWDPSKPPPGPSQELMSEARHEMTTAVYDLGDVKLAADLVQHPRDCACPGCSLARKFAEIAEWTVSRYERELADRLRFHSVPKPVPKEEHRARMIAKRYPGIDWLALLPYAERQWYADHLPALRQRFPEVPDQVWHSLLSRPSKPADSGTD